jgi:ubiquitin-protein ligase E3 C
VPSLVSGRYEESYQPISGLIFPFSPSLLQVNCEAYSSLEAFDLGVYQTFVYTFLTSSQLRFLQRRPESIAKYLSPRALSQSIVDAFSTPELIKTVEGDGLLWLLAHFVALNRTLPVSQDSSYLEALYLQMSFLSVEIRSRSSPQGTDGGYASGLDEDIEIKDFEPLPEYVADQLGFLVNDDGITDLLSRFAS